MGDPISLALVGAISLIVTAGMTPLIRTLALRLNVTDRPDGHRKLHARPIPLGGGVCILLATGATLLLAHAMPATWQEELGFSTSYLLVLIAACLVVVATGLADDRFSLRGRHKLLAQFVAAGILVGGGMLIQNLRVFGCDLELGLLAVPLTLLWLVGAMNALNLIDGMDGLASCVGMILSATIAVMAALNGRMTEAVVTMALAGSLAGFLLYNRPPARIYLGDAGSMLIGLIVGAMAIQGSLKGPATVAFAAPLALCTIPFFDTLAAVLRRKLTGRSIYTTDRGHIHHCLVEKFGSTNRALLWIGAACGVTSVGTLISVFWKNDLFALLTSVAVIAVFVTTRMFGHVEAQLVANRLKTLVQSLTSLSAKTPLRQGRENSIRLQGTRGWDLLWNSLLESTEKLNLSRMKLDVNMPAAHEGYHASWQSIHWCDSGRLWRTEIPLYAGDQLIGRLSISGEREAAISTCETIEHLMDLLLPFERQLLEMVGQHDQNSEALLPLAIEGPAPEG